MLREAALAIMIVAGTQIAGGETSAQTPPSAEAVTEQGVTVQAETSPLFLFTYRPGPAWRAGAPMHEQDLRGHVMFMRGLFEDGRLFAGGGYVGEDGGMAIVKAANAEDAHALFATDPAIVNGVFAGEVREWRPRFRTEAPLPRPPQ